MSKKKPLTVENLIAALEELAKRTGKPLSVMPRKIIKDPKGNRFQELCK